MKVEKKAVRSGILKLEKNVQITLDEDMNVPDTRPDVEKIIESRGEVHIDEIEVLTDRMRLRGNFLVQILYLSTDKEQQISCMEHEFSIEEFMNVESAESSDIAKVTADLEDLTISIINSRKCGVRSVIYFHIAISEMKFVECTTGIEKKENVQCLYESPSMTEIIMNKKDIQRIKASVSLPAGKPNIKEILWNSMQLRDVDIRMMENKLSIRGSLFLFILYQAEEGSESLQYYDWEIPFTNELDCADSQENLIGNIAVMLGNHQAVIKPDIDGKPRDVEIEAVLELDLKAYREFKMPLLKDMYANDRKLKLKTSPITFENLIFQNNAKTKVSQRVEAAGEIHKLLQVLNVEGNVRIEDFQLTKQGIATEGLIFCKVLYIAGDDTAPIQSKEIVIPFEYLVEIPEVAETDRCEIRGVLEQIGGYVVDSNELEIRAVAGIYVTGFSPQTMYMIDEVEEIPYSEEEISRIPSITGYIVKSGDTLWNIAKHYGTTIEKMKQDALRKQQWANKIESSKIGEHQGDRGYIGHMSARMAKRAKASESRRQRAIEEKSALLKDVEETPQLKLSALRYRLDRLAEFKNVALFYGEKQVCKEISFEINNGDKIAINGINGSGKSTLLRLIAGKHSDYCGIVNIRPDLTMSCVPQNTSFLKGSLNDFISDSNIDKTLFLTILRKMDFDRQQFDKKMENYSLGQKKKVVLARSLCQKAHLYLWDEPLNYIDLYSRLQIEQLLADSNITMVFVEHDSAFCNAVATKQLHLEKL